MKNGKKAISLVFTALAVVSLSGCSDVTSNSDGQILTYTYQGQHLDISTDDIIQKYLTESRDEHAKAFYDALYEIVVRASFEKGGDLSNYKDAVEATARDAVEEAKDSADNSGTSWHDYLVNQGYNDANMTDSERENEFYLDKLYTAMTGRVDTEFNSKFKTWVVSNDEVQKQYNALWGVNGYINKKLPYHVKHILVKVDASDDNGYSRGHISSDNAAKLYNTITSLVEGNSFSNVAKNYSDDTGSNTKGGEYIMDTEAGFVNEFQLGIYTYDTIINPQYKEQPNYDEKLDVLNITEDAQDELTDFGVTFIPYGVVDELNKVKDKTTTDNGLTIYDGDEDYFPRNIYFNKYFQNRNVGFITNETAFAEADFPTDFVNPGETGDNNAVGYRKFEDNVSGSSVFTDIDTTGHYKTSGIEFFKTGDDGDERAKMFKPLTVLIEGQPVTKNVLCDKEGNPILVVRNQESSGGVHFIIVERSAFDENDVNFDYAGYEKAGATGSYEEIYNEYHTTLNEYYAAANPKEKDGIKPTTNKPYYVGGDLFPAYEYEEGAYVPKKTYVQQNIVTSSPTNYVNDTVENYNLRVDDIDKKIDGMSSTTQFSKYEWLNSTLNLSLNEFTDAKVDVQGLVDRYINTQMNSQERSSAKSMQDKWTAYVASIRKQSWEREYNLLPEILAADFGNPELYKDGAPGYNAKYYTVNGNLTTGGNN